MLGNDRRLRGVLFGKADPRTRGRSQPGARLTVAGVSGRPGTEAAARSRAGYASDPAAAIFRAGNGRSEPQPFHGFGASPGRKGPGTALPRLGPARYNGNVATHPTGPAWLRRPTASLAMPTLAFWNVGDNVTPQSVADLAREWDVDILVLAESKSPVTDLLRVINSHTRRFYFPDAGNAIRFTILTAFRPIRRRWSVIAPGLPYGNYTSALWQPTPSCGPSVRANFGRRPKSKPLTARGSRDSFARPRRGWAILAKSSSAT